MAWTLDKNGVTPQGKLKDTEQQKLNDFMNAVRNQGVHPLTAAEDARAEYKKLPGTSD